MTRPFPAQSSVLDESALLDRVVTEYGLPAKAKSCRFLTRGDSDVYLVTCDDGARFFLKVRRPPVTREFCEAEAIAVNALAGAGLPVVRAVLLKRGGYSELVPAAEGSRPTLLFEEGPPQLSAPFDLAQSRQLGELLARIHETADALSLERKDFPDNDFAAIPKKVEAVIATGVLCEDDQAFLRRCAQVVVDRFAPMPRAKPDYGLCHGDLAPCNVRIDSSGKLWLFDFGAAHKSWRGDELANVWHRTLHDDPLDARRRHWEAFLAGYALIRSLPGKLDEFIILHDLARRIEKMWYICARLPLRLGIEAIDNHNLPVMVAELRDRNFC